MSILLYYTLALYFYNIVLCQSVYQICLFLYFWIRFLLQTLQVHKSNVKRPLVASCLDLVSSTWSSIWPSNIDGINTSYLNVHDHCRQALNGWPEAVCACIYASFFNPHNSLSRYIALYIFHALFLVKTSWNQVHIIPHNLNDREQMFLHCFRDLYSTYPHLCSTYHNFWQ